MSFRNYSNTKWKGKREKRMDVGRVNSSQLPQFLKKSFCTDSRGRVSFTQSWLKQNSIEWPLIKLTRIREILLQDSKEEFKKLQIQGE